MKQINYKGNILTQLEKAIVENNDMTIGEILFSVVHKDNTNGKHFFYMNDEEMYNAFERFNKFGVEEDEPLDEQGFEFWCAQKQIIK